MTDELYILATSSTESNGTSLDKHLHGYATIQFMEYGQCRVALDDDWYDLLEPSFFPAYPGPRIRFAPYPDRPYRHHRHIGFQGPLFGRWRAEGLWLEKPQAAPPGVDWGAYFEEMISHARRPGEWARRRTVNMIEGLLIQLVEARATAPVSEAWLHRTMQSLDFEAEAHWPASPDYAAVAEAVGLAEATLRRKFKTATGTSLHAFFLQRRVSAARRLLMETNMPIKEIAARLGYANVFFFSRQFREQAGVTPATLRRSRQ